MNQFQTVQVKRPPSNKFDLSHEKKLSCNMGDLFPFLFMEVLPGDRFKVSSEIFIRLAPMLAPVMHRVNVYTHYFFVPNRIVWEDWEEFITGGEDGLSTPVHPYIDIVNTQKDKFYKRTVGDYLGIPVLDSGMTVTQPLHVSALPFRSYVTIYNEYYRDQNLETKLVIDKGSGALSSGEITIAVSMRTRAWEKDYFTSSLPWAQRGAAVTLPFTASFTPTYESVTPTFEQGGGTPGAGAVTINASGDMLLDGVLGRTESLEDPQLISGATVTINELRVSVRLQEWLEKNARGGSRYIEQLLHHFGVSSSNKLLQRPQFLGGSKNQIIISEVLNTTGTTGELPQGNMAGHGVSYGKGNGFNAYFEEHGIVMGIMSILPRTSYQQGLAKVWRRFDKLDYAWPEFAQLGEQEVSVGEIYVDWEGTPGDSDVTFGYQARYAEYKFHESSVHGDFKDDLAFWHMGRIFAAQPVLNTAFIHADPTHRIFAVTTPSVDKLYCQIYNSVSAIRALPYFNSPTI